MAFKCLAAPSHSFVGILARSLVADCSSSVTTLEELLGRSFSQQRIVVMIAMISGFISKGISRSRNMAITMISASGEIIGLGYTTKSLTLQACFVLGFLLQTSLAYRLDPNPQTNSIFATVPSSSISSSTSSQSSSQLSSKHGVKVFYQSGVSCSNFLYKNIKIIYYD